MGAPQVLNRKRLRTHPLPRTVLTGSKQYLRQSTRNQQTMIETTEIEQRVVRKNELPTPLIPLEHLAWNYWWSWAADGESVFRDLDPEIWEECERNPRQLLAAPLLIDWLRQLQIRATSNVCVVSTRVFRRT